MHYVSLYYSVMLTKRLIARQYGFYERHLLCRHYVRMLTGLKKRKRMRPYILIPYYSATGACEELAMYIAKGVEQAGFEARIRRIPGIRKSADAQGPLYVSKEDIVACQGMIVGSPTRFGQMAAAVRAFWDTTGDIWYTGQLEGKPGAVFTASSSMHGGQESTLLGMMMPMIHHGMLIVGVPYSEKAIHETQKGGGPYGASALSGDHYENGLDALEKEICIALGKRVANIAKLVAKS